MKKLLSLCIGLTVVISIILTKLYSASVVQFINDTPEEIARMAELKPVEPVQVLQSGGELESEENDEMSDSASDDYTQEYMDTIVTENETMAVKVNPTYIDCIVQGDQLLVESKPVKFRIPENIKVKGKLIPANTFIYA